MDQRTSASGIGAQNQIYRHSSDRGQSPTRAAVVPRGGKPGPRNGVRPAVTARGRALLAQQRREAA